MSRIPIRFKQAMLPKLNKNQFDFVLKYADAMKNRIREGKGLLISGPPGVGKTFAVAALTNHYTQVHRTDYVWFTAPEMFDVIPAFDSNVQPFDEHRGQPWVKTISSVRWLVINDLGKEYRSGQLHDQIVYKLGRILRARSEKKLVTHITTNLATVSSDSETVKDVYGESIISLLREMIVAHNVDGDDRRRKKINSK